MKKPRFDVSLFKMPEENLPRELGQHLPLYQQYRVRCPTEILMEKLRAAGFSEEAHDIKVYRATLAELCRMFYEARVALEWMDISVDWIDSAAKKEMQKWLDLTRERNCSGHAPNKPSTGTISLN